ncbi:uncharacterized protein BYT42DRAFT_501247 [Radiomyces spectabilis]|uniref:uncharacterized protein n=1 Tax=Radiomyces spectabilis TaxID=64574 RepID=UPI002220B394|nr:uncharacterized protein BYT42DRAFT_501247 [Radiomyces spectabilis]KAI8371328.1 hypothetical protein BYT42DRAFT_501247 [Radiomyces spectabilis]
MRQFHHNCLEKTSRPPQDAVAYQRLIWLLDSPDCDKLAFALPSLLQDATRTWYQRMWRASIFQQNLYQLGTAEVDLGISEGPLSLFQSVETMACLNILSSVDKISVDAYGSALQQLKSLKEYLAVNVNAKDKRCLEIIMLVSMSRQLLNAGAELMDTNVYQTVCERLDQLLPLLQGLYESNMYTVARLGALYGQALVVLDQMITVLQQVKFSALFVDAISNILQAIQHYRNGDDAMFYTTAGKSRVLLGLTFLTSYIPDYPVDPTSEPRLRVNLLLKKQQEYSDSIDVRTKIEDIATGNHTNAAIRSSEVKLAAVNEELAQSSTTFSLRPEKSQLEDIFVDLRYLQKSMLDHNVEQLLKDLQEHGADSVLQRENLVQGNALQFIERVHSKFPLYRDVLQPLIVAVGDIKYGLRIMTSARRSDKLNENLACITELLVRNPDVGRRARDLRWHTVAEPASLEQVKTIIFNRSSTSRKWMFYLRFLIVVLQRLTITINSHGYIQAQDLTAINGLCSEVVRVWKEAQEYKRQQEAEKESMYKTRAKKYEPLTEEELDEADMKKMFANFNDDFADLTIDDQQQGTEPVSAAPGDVEEESVLDDIDIQRIGRLHEVIFSTYHQDACLRTDNTWDREAWQSYNIAGQLRSMSTSAFDLATDFVCNAGHLRMASLALRRLETEDSFAMTSDDIYDFYTSENIAEAKRVQPIIYRFKARVQQIASEWPEHAILEQLINISDRLLGFSIVSPVAKFLIGVELLLQKSEDWEAYAAKHVSLKEQREELIALIVRWRQLELNCWPKLLAAQEQYSQNAAFQWWFHLYDAVNNTSFQSGAEEDDKKKTQELLQALDHFIQSASLIEFEPRLTMINSFYRQSKVQAQLACSAEEKANHSTAATILRNVYLYYSQFKDHARTMLAQLRKPIEKELKEFVKIASWKDVNIYALRQSAQKTHRQLHKCIRKYREVLNNSMLTVIANYNQEHAMFQYGDEKRYNADIKHGFADQLGRSNLWLTKTSIPVTESVMNLDESVALKKHLANLPATLNRMRSYCGSDLFVTAEQQKELPLETFMTNIIQQIKEFQKETPAIMTDENKSLVKNQKLLKKKALVDFLKELRRLGLKWRAGTLVEQNADTSALFRQHVASLDAITQSRGLQKEPLSTYSVVSQDMIDLWNKANDYYYRCIARLTHLRTISTTQVSKDLSLLEVERSMSATEHMFSLVLKERTILSRMEERILVLQGFSVQMAAVYDATTNNKSISANTSLGCRLTAHKMAIDDLVSMLTEALATFTVQAEYDEVIRSMVVRMQAICTTVQKIQKATDNCYVQRYLFPRASTDVDVALLSEDVVEMMDMQCQTVREIESSLIEIVDQAQQSSHIIYPIIQSIESIRTDEPNSTVQNASDDISVLQLQQKVHSVIDAILVAVQDLKKSKSENDAPAASKEPSKEEEEEENDADDMPENYIRLQHQKQHALATALHTDLIARRCVEILNLISPIMNKANEADASSVSREISRLLQQVYPFVQQYMLVVQHTLGEIVLHHKSMAKLTYALINSFSVIISKGFCMPEGAADEEEGDADGTATGTGIGEGEGTKDVTEEIEDEEQVLGTQNEEQRKDEKQDTKEEKNGMEMENDFDGTLEDVEPDENEDQDQEEDSEDEEEELDDEIGDVDDMDPDAVDDKMWGEEGEENLNESDKTVDQAQPQGPKEADIVAKEEEEQQDPSKQGEQPEKSEEPQREEQRDQQNEDEQGEGEGEDMEEEDEEGPENRPGDQFNAEVPEAETLDLPDDMNLDGDEDQEGGDNEQEEDFFDAMDTEQGGEGDQMEEDEEDENEKYDDPLDHIQEGEADDAQAEDEEMADTTAQMEKDETGEDEMKTEGEEEKEEVENEEQQPVGDAEQGGGTIEEEEDEESALDNKAQNREQPNSDATADNQFGVQGEQGKASMSSTGQKEGENEASETAEADMKQDERSEEKGAAQRGANQAQQEDETGDNEEEKAEPSKANPQRSLGDALESWRRRLADVADAEDEDEEEATDDQQKQDETKADEAQVNEDHAFEYVKNDEEAHDMQTMSNAAADQVQDLKMGAMDEEMEDTEQHAGESEDVQPTDPEVDTMPLARDTLEMSGERDMGGAILSKQLPNERSLEEPDVLTVDESVVAHQPLEEEDIERMRDELETKVSEWRGEGRDINKARELWQGYENLTHDLAMGLCEQLRLILEPTLATKLKGDYRTGKRLNMKKIIPYIASQFKKDKIWLRRTKPSKRQYQVMISVDDSKSMSESHSVQLAYETLSLISKALSQLEVGDISIVSFGERIRLLHPFDQPFTSESGAQVLRQFTFAQQKTYVKNLVETSISLFENSKRSSGPGNAELWQLQLIISDGICEDHDTLKALVRRAMENQIMIIFIVVDNKPEKDSILNMTNVKYTTVNGKLSLQMTSYLETFPFNYFMVLRDINSLPEALSDALRQYFSFVAA